MLLKRKDGLLWGIFFLYLFILVQIILVKRPHDFLLRLKITLHTRDFANVGWYTNFKPFRTIWHLLFVDFHFMTALINIGGNILLFIPMGIYLSIYFKAPFKTLKIITACFLLSCFFEIFQLITICGFCDVDDVMLNTLGGAIGVYLSRFFLNRGNSSRKKMATTYVSN